MEENISCAKVCNKKLGTACYDNLLFIDKKLFAISNLFQLRVRHNLFTSKIPEILISNEIYSRKSIIFFTG